jgi:hypothetical protein
MDEVLQRLEAYASKFRGAPVKAALSADGKRLSMIGDRHYFPRGESAGTAISTKDDTLVEVGFADFDGLVMIYEFVGRLDTCGLNSWEWQNLIKSVLDKSNPHKMARR